MLGLQRAVNLNLLNLCLFGLISLPMASRSDLLLLPDSSMEMKKIATNLNDLGLWKPQMLSH